MCAIFPIFLHLVKCENKNQIYCLPPKYETLVISPCEHMTELLKSQSFFVGVAL